jgi:hypothetical protein
MKKLLISLCVLMIGAAMMNSSPRSRRPYFSYQRAICFGLGEYYDLAFVPGTGAVYQIEGVLTQISGYSQVTCVASNPHGSGFINNGIIYTYGDNTYGQIGNGITGGSYSTPQEITLDSAGGTLPVMVALYGGAGISTSTFGWAFIAQDINGNLWGWGQLIGGLSATALDGIRNRPVRIYIPGNPVIVKFQFSDCAAALDNTGKPWTWGGHTATYENYWLLGRGNSPDYTTPATPVGINSPIQDIGGGEETIFYTTVSGDSTFLTSENASVAGIGGSSYNNEMGGFGASAKAIYADPYLGSYIGGSGRHHYYGNTASSYCIRGGQLYAWGDNTSGSIGNGQEVNWASPGSAGSPWNSNQGLGWLLVQHPVQIMPGKSNLDTLYTNSSNCWYYIVVDSNQIVYADGRAKNGIMPTGKEMCDVGTNQIWGAFPNSLDYTAPIPCSSTTMFGSLVTFWSPACVSGSVGQGTSPCTNCSLPGTHTVTMGLTAVQYGTNQIIVTVTMTSSYAYLKSIISVTGSPPYPVQTGVIGALIDTMTVGGNGTYNLSVTGLDVAEVSASATASVTVTTLPTAPLQVNKPNCLIVKENENEKTIHPSADLFDPFGLLSDRSISGHFRPLLRPAL